MIDGKEITGWFAEDFTLAELRTLRARERIPAIRPQNARYDGLYQVPTLEEIVRLARAKEVETGRRIGLYPELKHPTFLERAAGRNMADLLMQELERLEVTPADPIYIQSFETAVLGRLNARSEYKLVQLINANGGPFDEPGVTYAEMITPEGLAEVATYADKRGLLVHAWTLRRENAFLPDAYRSSSIDSGIGCPILLHKALVRAGVDGVFTDNPSESVIANRVLGGAEIIINCHRRIERQD